MQISSSPIKRLRLSSISLTNGDSNCDGKEDKILPFDEGASLQSIVELTPKSDEKFEYPIVTNRTEELERESKELDSLIQTKFEAVKTIRESILDLQAKRYLVKDYLDVANKGHSDVRDLLNEIYNSGQELAKRAAIFTDEARRWHQKKFERIEFELSEKIEAKKIEVRDQMQQVTHEIELHQRTLRTLECQKEQKQTSHDAEESETSAVQQPAQSQSKVELKQEEMEQQEESLDESREKSERVVVDDDECVIIDGDEPETIEQQDTTGDNSGTTHTCDMEEDEQTDIEDQCPENDMDNTRNCEEKRPFTPCQAQRPV